MAIGDGGSLARQLRAAFDVGAIREWTDGQLLERFATGRAEVRELAFATLVERHGPMVLRTCRGVLGGRHDADDAFQATFLVLVRRSRGLWVRDSIGPWLNQVAHRTARAARVATARRSRLDRSLTTPDPTTEPDADLARIVQEEVARLSARDRAVVVLCDLEGQSHEQAARALDCPVGTVKSRLTRARDRLRARLARRGLAPDLAILAPSAPSLPSSLARLTTTAALRFATGGQSLVPPHVVQLATGVLTTMLIARSLQSAAATLAATLALVAGSSWLAAANDPQDQKVKPARREVATIEARETTHHQIVSETWSPVTPRAIEVRSDSVGGTLSEVVPIGRRVKQGEVLYRFDPSRSRSMLSNVEAAIAELTPKVQAATEAEAKARVELEAYEETANNGGRKVQDAEVSEIKAAVDRAEARVKRYRDVNDQVAKTAIDPGKPATLAQTLDRLVLLDRLDDAEAHLAVENLRYLRKKSEIVVAKAPSGPTWNRLMQNLSQANNAAVQIRTPLEGYKTQRDEILSKPADDTIRSPADGIVIQGTFGGHGNDGGRFAEAPSVGALIGRGLVLCQILIDPEPFQEIRLATEDQTMIDFLKPGQTVLLRIDNDAGKYFEGMVARTRKITNPSKTLTATFRSATWIDTNGNFSASPGQGMRRVAVIRLEKPEPSLPLAVGLEYGVDISDGVIRVPNTAIDRDRVAVRGPDGTFHWRGVETSQSNGSETAVTKMLAPGEVIALDSLAAMGEAPAPVEIEKTVETKP